MGYSFYIVNWVIIMEKSTYIVKINTALANKPFYIKIDHNQMSVDSIISESIKQLTTVGRPLASKQLEKLYLSHQLFCHGTNISKGTLFEELYRNSQEIEGKNVEIAEIDLVARHSGG